METEQDLKKPCFFVSYDCFVYCRDEAAVMENLETKSIQEVMELTVRKKRSLRKERC